MKVIENMKENILRFFLACQIVNIIEDQHIDHLVKMDEIILIVVPDGIDELVGELISSNVKNSFFRKIVFYLKTNRMRQVRFSQSCNTIYKEWVKCSFSGVACNGETCRSGQTVAIAFNEIIERITLNQL